MVAKTKSDTKNIILIHDVDVMREIDACQLPCIEKLNNNYVSIHFVSRLLSFVSSSIFFRLKPPYKR